MAPPETETTVPQVGSVMSKAGDAQDGNTAEEQQGVEALVEEATQSMSQCQVQNEPSAQPEPQYPKQVVVATSQAPPLQQVTLPPGIRRCVELQQVVVNEDPRVVLFKNFLNDEEIEYLLKLADGRFRPSLTGTADAYELSAAKDNKMSLLQEKTSSNRTSFSCVLDTDDPVVRIIVRRVAFVAGYPEDHVERLSLLRYEPGQYFKEHHDGQFRPRTVFIYLNTLPEGDGGETQFPRLGMRFRPTKGVAFMWSNALPDGSADMRLVHQALPPLTTTKYGMNCFVNERARTSHPANTESIVH